MTNKSNFRKKKRLKNKMKGGNGPEFIPVPGGAQTMKEFEKFHASNQNNRPTKSKSSGSKYDRAKEKVSKIAKTAGAVAAIASNYGEYKMSFFLYVIVSIGLVGVGWLLVSRNLIRHEYSESLSYGLISLAVSMSFFLVLIAGLSKIKPEDGILNHIKYIFKIAMYCLSNCLPAILILIQTLFLVWLFSKHSDYLYSSNKLPALFRTFNMMSIVMVVGQSYVWWQQLETVLIYAGNKYEKGKKKHTLVAGFILAAILSSVAISQMYVILEYLKTDC